MSSLQAASSRWSWLSVWFSPRQAIDEILATQPVWLVWLFAGLGEMSGIIEMAVQSDRPYPLLFDWRVEFALIVGAALLGILLVCLSAVLLGWFGRWFGASANFLERCVALSWSMLPYIAGALTVLAINLVAVGSGNESVRFVVRASSMVLLLTASVWAAVIAIAMLSRVLRIGTWRTIVIYAMTSIVVLLVPVLIRTFLFQSFTISSSSMAPALTPGDYVVVSKYDYGYSHYSFPLSLPLFAGRVFGSRPERGDVVVFRSPKDDAEDYIKRVLGLPGDRVQMKAGVLYINDIAIPRTRLADLPGRQSCSEEASGSVKRWRETLSNGVSYETLDCVDEGFYDNTEIYTVPMGHFFALGDNRDNSTDSRVLSYLGYVPIENIVGRVKWTYRP